MGESECLGDILLEPVDFVLLALDFGLNAGEILGLLLLHGPQLRFEDLLLGLRVLHDGRIVVRCGKDVGNDLLPHPLDGLQLRTNLFGLFRHFPAVLLVDGFKRGLRHVIIFGEGAEPLP